MRRPSFQFYPADWRNNANLRRCSWEARGVWIEVMGLMHDSDRYGVLSWPLKEIAQALGAPVRHVQELATKGVIKGCDAGPCGGYIYVPRSGRRDGDPVPLVAPQDGPIWYSSRMVKDEHVRSVRGESTRFDGDPDHSPNKTPKVSPKPALSDGSTSSSSTTPSGNNPPKPPRKRRGAAAEQQLVSVEQLVAEGVEEQHAKDWLTVRGKKTLPLTLTAWEGVKSEAARAGLPLGSAIKTAVENGWGGFKAKWLVEGDGQRAKAEDWTGAAV